MKTFFKRKFYADFSHFYTVCPHSLSLSKPDVFPLQYLQDAYFTSLSLGWWLVLRKESPYLLFWFLTILKTCNILKVLSYMCMYTHTIRSFLFCSFWIQFLSQRFLPYLHSQQRAKSTFRSSQWVPQTRVLRHVATIVSTGFEWKPEDFYMLHSFLWECTRPAPWGHRLRWTQNKIAKCLQPLCVQKFMLHLTLWMIWSRPSVDGAEC